jgi:hypothetical protein
MNYVVTPKVLDGPSKATALALVAAEASDLQEVQETPGSERFAHLYLNLLLASLMITPPPPPPLPLGSINAAPSPIKQWTWKPRCSQQEHQQQQPLQSHVGGRELGVNLACAAERRLFELWSDPLVREANNARFSLFSDSAFAFEE